MTPEQIYFGCIFFVFGFIGTFALIHIYTQCVEAYKDRRKLRIMLQRNQISIE